MQFLHKAARWRSDGARLLYESAKKGHAKIKVAPHLEGATCATIRRSKWSSEGELEYDRIRDRGM